MLGHILHGARMRTLLLGAISCALLSLIAWALSGTSLSLGLPPCDINTLIFISLGLGAVAAAVGFAQISGIGTVVSALGSVLTNRAVLPMLAAIGGIAEVFFGGHAAVQMLFTSVFSSMTTSVTDTLAAISSTGRL